MRSDNSNRSVPDVERSVKQIRAYREKDYKIYDYTIYSLPIAITITLLTPLFLQLPLFTSVLPIEVIAAPVLLSWLLFWGLFILGGYYEWRHKSLSPGLCNHCGGELSGNSAKDTTLTCTDCDASHNRVNAH